MNTNKRLFAGAFAIALGAFCAAAALGLRSSTPLHFSQASWVFKSENLAEQARYADVIALAEVVASYPIRIATSTTGEDPLPFELVELRVLRALKGAQTGDVLFVERAGGTAPDGRVVKIDADGGDFSSGETSILFLKKQEQGEFHYIINDLSRFRVDTNADRVSAFDPDQAFARHLHGRRVEQVLAMIDKALAE